MKTNTLQIEVIENFADPLWRLNNLYWIVDDTGRKIPFRMNDTQEKLFKEMWYWNLILKSRQHGITTFVDLLGLDQTLFNDNFSAGICAHTREDVEKIFRTKVKFPYDNLPEGLKNARPADTDSAKMLVFNNGSSIEVATSLRSGTYQFGHISEFGKICAKYPDKAQEIVTGTFETIHPGSYLWVESTAEGREGYFYRYVQAAQKREQEGKKPNKLEFKFHFFAWWQDARNQLSSPKIITKEYSDYFKKLETENGIKLTTEQKTWYMTKAETLGDDMKREHPSTPDEAFEVAVSGAYLFKQMAAIRKGKQITVVPHDPSLPVNTSWDFGLGDTMCIWFHQYGGLQHRLINYIEGTDDDVLYYWKEIQRMPYILGSHFMPHDATTRRIGTAKNEDSNPRTLEEILTEAGMKNIKIVPKIDDKYTAIQETRLFLPICWIDEEKCEQGILGLDNFRREWDEKNADWKNKPLHNWAMHPYDSFETLARGIKKYGCSAVNNTYIRPPRAGQRREVHGR